MNMKSAISCRQKNAACWLIVVDMSYCYHYYQLFTFPPTKGMATRKVQNRNRPKENWPYGRAK